MLVTNSKATKNGTMFFAVGSITCALLLAGCGGGGGSTAGTPAAVTTIASIQAGLTTMQNLFAVAVPLPASITSLLDPTFMHDGQDGAAFATWMTGVNGIPVGGTFSSAVAINPPDPLSPPNDATHQWFSTRVGTGNTSNMLSIKNAAGAWVNVGNQRKVGVATGVAAFQTIYPAASLKPASYQVSINFILYMDYGVAPDVALLAAGVTSATVSGPGVIGATAGVQGPVTVFNSAPVAPAVAGSQSLHPCNIVNTTNCINTALVVPGTYVFTINGTTPGVGTAFAYTYNEANAITPPAISALAPAKFPVISGVAPATMAGLLPGAVVTGNWTMPTGYTAKAFGVNGNDALGVSLINTWVNIPGANSAFTTQTSSVTLPQFTGVLFSAGAFADVTDPTGVLYSTNQQF